jgi:hypothetical protein
MPPRTTQKSHRPRVSDRTMVGNRQPAACKRLRSCRKNANEDDAENLPRTKERKPCPGEVCCRCQQGLDVSKNPSPGGSGEVFLLDIPFYRTRSVFSCRINSGTTKEVAKKLRFSGKIGEIRPSGAKARHFLLRLRHGRSRALTQCGLLKQLLRVFPQPLKSCPEKKLLLARPVNG